jgi:hypothetical protein
MFIKRSQSGYNQNGEQFARGSFLLLFSHNPYMWEEQNKRSMPKDLERKLYACVRHVSLRQFGNFMMGTVRIAGQSVTVSGCYGGNGLPKDYEKLTPVGRTKLVEVPAELAEIFWRSDDRHNSAGSEGPLMRDWARNTFSK